MDWNEQELVHVSIHEIEELAKRVRILNSSEIDELWHMSGWIDIDRGMNNSLPNYRIKSILNNEDVAKQQIINLLCDDPHCISDSMNLFLENLWIIERKKNKNSCFIGVN